MWINLQHLRVIFSFLSKAAIFILLFNKIKRFNFMGRLCFLVATLEFYKRVFHAFLGFLFINFGSFFKVIMIIYNDFGFGVFKFFNVFILFFMFLLGFKVLKFGGSFSFSNISEEKRVEIDKVVDLNDGFDEFSDEDEENEKICDVDKVFDVMSLRKMVKNERYRGNLAYNELEKERIAASSAASEAMAMILRLQNEKSSLQLQVNQLQRVNKEQQFYDQDVIQSLEWIVMKHETERSLLEDELRLCREKLKLYVKSEEWDGFDGRKFEVVPISSLDLEFSPM